MPLAALLRRALDDTTNVFNTNSNDGVAGILLALFDDCIMMLSIFALMFLIRIGLQRYWGRHSSTSCGTPQKKSSALYEARARMDSAESCRGTSKNTPIDSERRLGAAPLRIFGDAIKSGHAAELPRLLDEAAARRAGSAGQAPCAAEDLLNDLLACLRMCVTGSCFKEGLAAYDHVAARLGTKCGFLWSILLYCTVEAGDLDRCPGFMQKIWDEGTPSLKDLINMARYFVQQKDGHGMITLLRQFRQAGVEVDVLTRNRVLTCCITGGEAEMAERVVAETPETPMDIIGYHALIKGWSQSGNVERCFELYKQLREHQEPNRITFGLVLDVCVEAGSVENAREIFSDLQASRGLINVVHYTSFIRCLTKAGEFQEAIRVFENMLVTPGVTPDTGSWYSLVKALADNGFVEETLRVVEQVRRLGLEFNQVAFNVVLNGCSVKTLRPDLIVITFERLLSLGMQPTTSTMSVMVKAFARSEAWIEAEAFLSSVQSRFGIVLDKRVFAQLHRAKKESFTCVHQSRDGTWPRRLH